MDTILRLKPHLGASGVPFMNTIVFALIINKKLQEAERGKRKIINYEIEKSTNRVGVTKPKLILFF